LSHPASDAYRKLVSRSTPSFKRYTDVSRTLDEVYLDVTQKVLLPYATTLLKQAAIFNGNELDGNSRIFRSTNSSENGIRHQQARWTDGDFARTRPGLCRSTTIEKFHGIDKSQLPKMHNLGIHHGADLKQHYP